MSKRSLYRTTFKFVVLSEEPTTDLTVADMIEACDSGPMVGDTEELEMVILTGGEMTDALYKARLFEEWRIGLDDGEEEEEEDLLCCEAPADMGHMDGCPENEENKAGVEDCPKEGK